MVKRRVLAGGMLAALLCAAGLTFAQESEPESVPGEAETEVVGRADLSPEEQLAEAARVQTRGTQISRRIQAMLDEARRERDIIRVTCLNDKLTQVNANLRTLEDRIENLQSAVQAQDPSRRNHEFTVITVLSQKFNVLEQEANQCLGQDLFETGATRVETDIDPDSPTEDPTVLPETLPPAVPFIPPPASPSI